MPSVLYAVSISTASMLNTGTHTEVTSDAKISASWPPRALASGMPIMTWLARNVAWAMTTRCARSRANSGATATPSPAAPTMHSTMKPSRRQFSTDRSSMAYTFRNSCTGSST